MDSKERFDELDEAFFRRGEELENAVEDDLSDLDDEPAAEQRASFRLVTALRRRMQVARAQLRTALSRQ